MKSFKLVTLVSSIIFVFKMNAQPCNIQALATHTVLGDTITFSNASTGTVTGTSYKWILYYGYMNPATPILFTTTLVTAAPYTFTASGQHQLVLIASNNATCADTNITFVQTCDNSPSYTPTLSIAQNPGGIVSFTPEANGPSMVQTLLEFGDASNAWFALSPYTHTYFNGTFTPSLNVIFGPSCQSIISPATITVTDNPCFANAAFTYTVGSSGSVLFSKTAPVNNTIAFWDFGDGYSSTLTNPSHTYASAGNFHVVLDSQHPNNNYNNCHDTSSVNINITGIPCVANANFTIQPTGQPHTYWIIPGNPYNISSVLWSWGDGNTTSSSNIYANHTYSAAGTYDVCLTVTTTCGGTLTNVSSFCSSQYLAKGAAGDMLSLSVIQPKLISGIKEAQVESMDMELFPNPTNGELNIKIGTELSSIAIEIYDLLGKKLYSESVKDISGLKKIDISQLNNGIYFLYLKLPDKNLSSKFILSK